MHSLKNHERFHKGEKPFACSQCEEGFHRRVSLNMHERSHTGDKQFACSYCDKSLEQWKIEATWKDPHQREAVCLHKSVKSNLATCTVWRTMKDFTRAKSHLHGPNVKRDLTESVWICMEGSTQEISNLPVPIVKNHLKRVIDWIYMKRPTLERSCLHA